MASRPRKEPRRRRAAPAPWRPDRRVLFILCAAYSVYFVNGILNAEIGPSLLGMVHTFHIDLAAAGVIFTAQFIGYLPGAVAAGFAADRWAIAACWFRPRY